MPDNSTPPGVNWSVLDSFKSQRFTEEDRGVELLTLEGQEFLLCEHGCCCRPVQNTEGDENELTG